jgi:site-specific recombinase XerD
MNEAEFRLFLKRGGRTPAMAERVIRTVRAYADYLAERGLALGTATVADLDAYVDWLESDPKTSAKGQLHAIRYYYQYSGQKDLEKHAHQLR